MINNGFPEFMQQVGAFSWTRAGYYFDTPGNVNLLAEGSLASANPWIVVAAVLERAKQGDHSNLHRLKQFFFDETHTPLHRVSILMVGDISREDDLPMLVDLMKNEDEDIRIYAALAAERAGSLWLVPHMLEAWHDAVTVNGRESIGYAIGSLLEADNGPISNHAGTYSLSKEQRGPIPAGFERFSKSSTLESSSETFDSLVRTRYSELKSDLSREDVPVFEGKRFGVLSFARQLKLRIPTIAADVGLWDLITLYRQKLEVSTGIDCSGFFRDDRFYPLGAASVVESFLESGAGKQYEEGVRYFWGHPIPA